MPDASDLSPPRETMATKTSRGGGGGATHAGTNYQDYVAAWVAVQILAEQDVAPPWNLPAKITLEALHAEAPNPIDDLTVHTSGVGVVLSQAKHSANLETTPGSALGSTSAQFVREYCTPGKTFDPANDRFVLITSSLSSGGVKVDLPAFLTRMRTSSHPDSEWAAGSADQQHAATVLRDHLMREWQTLKGGAPTETELTTLVRLIYIHILDVDPGGQATQEAKNTLRQRILKDPTTADTAWNTLVTTTATYATNHQRADRPALQRALTDVGLDLQAQRSYRDDIERLKAHTATTLQSLLEFSRIRVGTDIVTIQRASATEARIAAEHGHLLVLGVPGAGKSGALYDAARSLTTQGADVILFAIDQLEAASTGALRNELNLDHEFVKILTAWPGVNPGYLIIDALDAARTDAAVKTLHTIMTQVVDSKNRWHVIASVRKFDLRYNHKLQQLFAGTPPSSTYVDKEFALTRHVNIATLTGAELAQVGQQSHELAALMTAAPKGLQELLRLPFNLRLLADLLGSGTPATELQPLTTQIELLDRYWQERIIRHDNRGDARELVLRRTTNAMVKIRALRTERTAAVADDAASGAFLDDLLSTHILEEWTSQNGKAQRDFLRFPHHLLYDYAVARLSIPLDQAAFITRLTAEPDLLLVIRPSIDLFCQRRWHTDRDAFWSLTFNALNSSLPEVGKLIAPSVAALHATNVEQLQPLLNYLHSSTQHATGIAALQHILSTLLTHGTTSGVPLKGPWIEFLDQASEYLTPQLSSSIRPYTIFLSERFGNLGTTDGEHLGRIARRLLAYALTNADPLLAISSINAVVKTITTDPKASIEFLQGCITEAHLTTYGYRTLPTLARSGPTLAAVDATFAQNLYVAAFKHQDESNDVTNMGDSNILPMTSNRKQDYDHGLWQLAEHYPAVLQLDPARGLDALLDILDHYVRSTHRPSEQAVPVEFEDVHTSILQDYSRIWDQGYTAQHDYPLSMLNAFQKFLESSTDPKCIEGYLRQVANYHPPAVVWRRLLAAGAKQPTTIGHALRSLTWDPNILLECDTTRPVGKLLQAIHTTMTEPERERVELAIMAIPDREGVNVEVAKHHRDRLLGCLSPSHLVTATAKEQLATITAETGPPSNDEVHPIAQWGTLEPSPTTTDPTLAALLSAVSSFATKHLNSTPTSEEVTTIIPAIVELAKAITTPSGAMTPALESEALTHIGHCAVGISRTEVVSDEQAALLLPIILRATIHESPIPDPSDDQQKPVRGWGGTPRIAAADAIAILAGHPACCTDDARDAIRRLSVDPVCAVRVQIATRVLCLYKTDENLMWELLEHYASKEENPTVLADAVQALARLPIKLASKSVPLAVTIFRRSPDTSDTKSVHEACIYLFCGISLWGNDPTCKATLDTLIADPVHHAQNVQRLVFALGRYLTAKEMRVTDAAFGMLHRILIGLMQQTQEIETANQKLKLWPPDVQESYGALLRCADSIAQRLYFASGAFKNADQERTILPPDVFYERAKPVLTILAGIGYPHTAHYVIDTLRHFIQVDPPGVLLLVGAVVRTGSKYGYEYEQLAEGLMVELVERYLAEYRPLLREQTDCHMALMDILDVFVRVGWTRAHRLTYQLGDIYR